MCRGSRIKKPEPFSPAAGFGRSFFDSPPPVSAGNGGCRKRSPMSAGRAHGCSIVAGFAFKPEALPWCVPAAARVLPWCCRGAVLGLPGGCRGAALEPPWGLAGPALALPGYAAPAPPENWNGKRALCPGWPARFCNFPGGRGPEVSRTQTGGQ